MSNRPIKKACLPRNSAIDIQILISLRTATTDPQRKYESRPNIKKYSSIKGFQNMFTLPYHGKFIYTA